MWREGEDKPMAHRAVRLFHRCETELQHLFATGRTFSAQVAGKRSRSNAIRFNQTPTGLNGKREVEATT
jgi:hypothetical protein